MTPPPFSAAVVQAPLHALGDAEPPRTTMARNVERMVEWLDRLARLPDPPRIVVFPVLSFTGSGGAIRDRFGTRLNYARDVTTLTFHDGEPLLDPLIAACRRHDCYMATSGAERLKELPGRYLHTGIIVGPDGLLLRSPKTQAPTSPTVNLLREVYAEYLGVFGADSVLPVIRTPYGTLGCLVEGEALVSETARTLRRKGAQIVLHTSVQWTRPDSPPYQAINQSLAYTNSVYWLSAAASREIVHFQGQVGEVALGGGSCIVGPDGRRLAGMVGNGEGFVQATIDLAQLERVRTENAARVEPVDIFYQRLYATEAGHAAE